MKSRPLRRLAALLFGLALALAAAELGLRVVGFAFLFERGRPAITEPRIVPGMPPFPVPAADAFRILCIGNSHTQGASETLRGAFPHQLEELLQAKYPGRRFQVINAGRGNWNSSEVLEHLPGFLADYHPRVVFAMLG